jgi:sulfatase maturation enzyme AslB (radical SAM superfamily)
MHEDYKLTKDDSNEAGNYTLYLTYKCNWVCDYCSEDTHNRNSVSEDEIRQKIDTIPNGSEVSITGGEPGVLKAELLSWVLTELKNKECIINVNTNGTFFKRHPKLCAIPDSFLYHCSEHLEDEEIYIPDFIDKNKIDFQLVITDGTMHRLEYYINKYPDIHFLIFGADYVNYGKGRMSTGLSRKNGFEIYRKYKDRIHPNSYIYLVTTCREVNIIRNLTALR